MDEQYVDPNVSRAKFDREVAEYRRLEDRYRERGWFLLDAQFPRVVCLLATARLKPPAVITGVSFDFTNYDAAPPSVRLVDPFTGTPYPMKDIPTTLQRSVTAPAPQIPGLQLPPGMQGEVVQHQPLMVAYGADEIPFLCIAGTREYHEHPGHSGDAWELHRVAGAGRLARLLDVIHRYGVEPITGFNVELVPKVSGFIQQDVPK